MVLKRARKVLELEAKAVADLADRLGGDFEKAVEIFLACTGKVIVIGIGKSGHIATKIAATLASTGTPSFFIHPAEGVHGDVGMIDKNDALLVISNSGETEELARLIPSFKRIGVPIVGLLGNPDSSLAKASDVVLDVSVKEEACPLNLAPTCSTTAALAMGDAIAVALLEKRGFTEEDFAARHPAGTLGKKLLKVSDIYHFGPDIPMVKPDTPFKEVVIEISSKLLGHAAVVSDGKLLGVIADGDLRRAMKMEDKVFKLSAKDIMVKSPKWISPDEIAQAALAKMEKHSITALLVCDDKKGERLVGLIHFHDLLKAGVV